MDHNPMTAADFAGANANEARKENKRLAARVEALEHAVELLCFGLLEDALRVLNETRP